MMFKLMLTIIFVGLSSSYGAVTFDWVTVGNGGNDNDASGYGGVAETYRIAKYEVTNAQYTEFLNAAAQTDGNNLYNANMNSNDRGGITQSGSSGSFTYAVKANMGDKPVNYVSFFDAMRFSNWLENGQGAGSTESGVYSLGTGLSETRSGTASFFLPSEDEWYKAAYHDPANAGADANGTTDYWLYPTQSDSAPTIATADGTGNIDNDTANIANYLSGADWNSQNGNVTTVGSGGTGSESYYGAADLGGNVYEWNEAIISGSSRGIRGGAFSYFALNLQSSDWNFIAPTLELNIVGFRVASSFDLVGGTAAPEPNTLCLLGLGLLVLKTLHRQKRLS